MIETERLLIRPFTLADADAYARTDSDPAPLSGMLAGLSTRENDMPTASADPGFFDGTIIEAQARAELE